MTQSRTDIYGRPTDIKPIPVTQIVAMFLQSLDPRASDALQARFNKWQRWLLCTEPPDGEAPEEAWISLYAVPERAMQVQYDPKDPVARRVAEALYAANQDAFARIQRVKWTSSDPDDLNRVIDAILTNLPAHTIMTAADNV